MRKWVILIVVSAMSHSYAFGKGGILNSSYDEVSAMLGRPSSHDHGTLSGIAYERYHFETRGWKTAVLFIEGKAQKFDTQKSDGAPLSNEEQKAILEGYDLPNGDQNAKLQGWRELSENHFIRGDGRVHVIKRAGAMIVFLDDLPRDFW